MSTEARVAEKSSEQEVRWYDTEFEVLSGKAEDRVEKLLHAHRAESYRRFIEGGIPTSKNEEWKYTDIRELETRSLRLAAENGLSQVDEDTLVTTSLSARRGESAPLDGAILLHTIDGYLSDGLTKIQEELPEGIELASLRLSQDGLQRAFVEELVGEYFGKGKTEENDPIVDLQTALFSDVLCLRVKKGAQIDQPILLEHVSTGLEEDTVTLPRVLCVVEEGASCTVIERFRSLSSAPGCTLSVTECFVKDDGNLNHYQLGEEGEEHLRISRISAHQGKRAQAKMHSYSFGGRLVRNEVQPTLAGEEGFAGMYGISVLHNQQHVDNHTVLDHAVPHCESDERYKGIYDGNSRGVFCGTIIVRPDAQKTNAIQNNAAILLSDRASIRTKPQLKIWADDVKCTHGATVGQLDENQLFYLRSRGIGRRAAQGLLLRAFAGEVTQEVGIPGLRTYLEERIVEKLSL
ncbi:Fe-S cluster assembly protein SufD [bacterium]|nr:Fe-S cluster assembly protein SufD [bacterium]